MKHITLSNSPGLRWSAQLRLNAVWILWLSYLLGLAFSQKALSSRQLWLDLFVLAAGNVLSAIWNDRVDKQADANNGRHVFADTITRPLANGLLIASSATICLAAAVDPYRALFALCAILCG